MATGFHTGERKAAAKALAAAALAGLIPWGPGALPLSAGDDEPARHLGAIFEGDFAAAEVTRTPEGARHTRLAAAYEWDYGVRHFTEEKWEERGFDWDQLLAAARRVADALVAKIEPRFVRDGRGVIEYAVVAEEDPFLTSIVLSPGLRDRFRDTLGDRLHAVLVDRHVVYLFPATGGPVAEYGPALVERFRRTDLPVSLEVFLIDEDGYRVVGELERDPDDPADQSTRPASGTPESGSANGALTPSSR